MSIKKIFSFAASIISLVLFIFLFTVNSISDENNVKVYSKDEGVLAIMYHRFKEMKFPSTNISMDIFKQHIVLVRSSKLEFYHPDDLKNDFSKAKKEKKSLSNQ